MALGKKGQTSIEMILVTLIILVGATMVLGNYFTIYNSTNAIMMVRTMTLRELQKYDDFYFIDKILTPVETEGATGDDATIGIRICPEDPGINWGQMNDALKDKTNYVNLTVAYVPCV